MVNGLLQRQGCELLDESPLGLSGSVLKWIAWQLLHSLKALHEEQVRRQTQWTRFTQGQARFPWP